MVRHASLFSQLVAFFRLNEFHNLVFRHNAERYAKGFSSWDQFVAMLFCQFAQAKSLSLFPWANFRRTKGAVKLHLLLVHDGYLPTYAYNDIGHLQGSLADRTVF